MIGCGKIPNQERIFGGFEVTPQSLPWQVGIRGRKERRPSCGGVLISHQHILTSVICTRRRYLSF